MKYLVKGNIVFLIFIMSMFYVKASEPDSTTGLHVIIDVKSNGDLIVTEQFDINAGGYIFKHGIYRRIPLLLEGQYGGKYLAGFKMLDAQLNNAQTPYEATISNGKAVIKVGDPAKKLEHGPAKFVISYQLSNEIRFFKHYDELYFNAIPHHWVTTIEKSTVVVNLPEQSKALKWKAYTGQYSETAQDYLDENPKPNQVKFTAISELGRAQGMTVVVALPKGIIDESSVSYFIFLLGWLEWVLLITFVVTVGSFVYWSWRKVGVYPDESIIAPDVMNIPKEVTPAIINYILNHAVIIGSSTAELVAASTNLAIKGYLDISYESHPCDSAIKEGSYYTHILTLSLKDSLTDTSLPKSEQCILDWVIKQGGSYQISRKNRKLNKKLLSQFSGALSKDLKSTSIFTWNIKYTLLTLALSCFFVGLQLLLGVSDWSDIFYGPLVLLVTFPVAILWLGIYESLFEEKDENNEPQWEKKGLMVCVTWLPWMWFLCSFLPLLSISVAFLLLFFLTALTLNRGPTQYGKPLLSSAKQIKEYISAKKKPEEDNLLTIAVYEQLLPYAVSLELQDEWSERFDDALRFKRAQFRKLKKRQKIKVSESLNPYRYKSTWFLGNFSDQTECLSCIDSMSYSALGASAVASSMSSSGFSGGGGGGGGGGW